MREGAGLKFLLQLRALANPVLWVLVGAEPLLQEGFALHSLGRKENKDCYGYFK